MIMSRLLFFPPLLSVITNINVIDVRFGLCDFDSLVELSFNLTDD